MIPVTAKEASQLLPVSPSTIRNWASRGWTNERGEHQQLTPHDNHGPRRTPRYWLTDLQVAERDTRRNRRRCHRQTAYKSAKV